MSKRKVLLLLKTPCAQIQTVTLVRSLPTLARTQKTGLKAWLTVEKGRKTGLKAWMTAEKD